MTLCITNVLVIVPLGLHWEKQQQSKIGWIQVRIVLYKELLWFLVLSYEGNQFLECETFFNNLNLKVWFLILFLLPNLLTKANKRTFLLVSSVNFHHHCVGM